MTDINFAALDYYFDDVYDEASFRCDLKHSCAERRSAALLAERALRQLARLRATNDNVSFVEAYEDVFDRTLIERDLRSSDDMLRITARKVVHELVELFDMRIDEKMGEPLLSSSGPPTAEDIERARVRRMIEKHAELRRSRPTAPPVRLRLV